MRSDLGLYGLPKLLEEKCEIRTLKNSGNRSSPEQKTGNAEGIEQSGKIDWRDIFCGYPIS